MGKRTAVSQEPIGRCRTLADMSGRLDGDTMFVDGASTLEAYPELHKLAGG